MLFLKLGRHFLRLPLLSSHHPPAQSAQAYGISTGLHTKARATLDLRAVRASLACGVVFL